MFDPEEPFMDRHIEEAEVLRRYIDTEYMDTLSMRSYCACSMHAEDVRHAASCHVSPHRGHVSPHPGHVTPVKLSQQKLEQVRDAVLVVRNWKHSKHVED